MKVCLVKTSSMGDVIHTLPALTDAQNAIADLQVDWVVEENFAEIPHWHSAVKQVIPMAIRRWRKQLFSVQTWQQWRNYKTQLQATDYDVVIDAQGLFKSAFFVTCLARGTKCGYDKYSAREGMSSYFYDRCFTISYQQHAVERIRLLFANSLGYVKPDTVGDYGLSQHFANFSANLTACSPYLIAIHATTRADKHWSEQAWRTLFQQLPHQQIYLPWGNEAEYQRAKRLAQHCANVEVLPKLSLVELAYKIATAKAVISVDTGLSHLTASLDKPNIILYGATDPKLIGAYGKYQHHLVANGMDDIRVEQVLQRLALLGIEN